MKRGMVTALVAAVLLLGSLVLMAGGALAYAWAQQNPILVAGVSAAEKTQDEEEAVPEAEPGIVIIAVEPDSPAAKAGVARGDILLRVNGTETNSLHEVFQALDSLAAGEKVTLELTHGDEARTLTATLDDRGERPFLGIHGIGGEMTMARRTIFVGEGALIAEVQDNSPALAAGLTAGEVVLSVDGEKVTPEKNLPDQIAARAPGDSVTLEVQNREGETREVTVTLGTKPDAEVEGAYLGVKLAPVGAHHFALRGGPHIGVMPFGPGGPELWEMPFEGMPFDGPLVELPEGVTEALIVAEVMRDGPAAEAGLTRHDLIVALDGQAITSPEELRAAIQAKAPGDKVTLTIRRGDAEPTDIEVTLGENETGDAHLGIGLGHIKRIEGEGGVDAQMDFFIPALPALPSELEGGERFELPLPPGFPGGEGQEDFLIPAQPAESQAI